MQDTELEHVDFWPRVGATLIDVIVIARAVDAETGKTLNVGQAVGRCLGYFVSILPLGLGMLWVAFDRKKQGWHDKMAGTVVVRPRREGDRSEPVKFETPG